MFWEIKYRARFGPATLKVQAPTREEAEVAFYDELAGDDEFGVIIRVTPIEQASQEPQA